MIGELAIKCLLYTYLSEKKLNQYRLHYFSLNWDKNHQNIPILIYVSGNIKFTRIVMFKSFTSHFLGTSKHL